MVEDEDRPNRPGNWLLISLGSCIAFLAFRFTLDSVLVVPGSILFTPSAGLAVPFGIAFGVPAALGLFAGVVTAQAIQAGLTVLGLFEGLSLMILALVSARGWGSELELSTGSSFDIEGVDGFVTVATVGTIGGAAVLAWGGELLGLFPFYVLFVETLLGYLVATAVVGSLLTVGLHAFAGEPGRNRSAVIAGQAGFGFVLVPVLWSLLGVIGSVGFNIRERIPRSVFEDMGVEFLYHLVHPDIFGTGGRRVQVVFGALMLVVWAYTYRRAKLSKPSDTTATFSDENAGPSLDTEQTAVSSQTEEMEV